jgi:hypothetical protein
MVAIHTGADEEPWSVVAVKAEDARPLEADARSAGEDARPHGGKPGADNLAGVAAGTLVVLCTLALVAYMVKALRPAAPVEIAEVIAAAGGLLAAAAAAYRAMRSR